MKDGRFCFAVVGTGSIADRFLDALSRTEGACAAAVFSRRKETGDAFAAKHGGLAVFTDYDRLLSDGEIDGVYIATPHFCHKEQTLRALRAGRHVLVEKSAALNVRDFVGMRREAEAAGRILLEAMRPDFDPAYDALRAGLSRIGRIRRVSLTFCQYSSRYDAFRRGEVKNAFDPAIGNSALLDIGVYPLHIALSLFGMPEKMQVGQVYLENGFEGAGNLLLSYEKQGFFADIAYSKVQDAVLPSAIEGEDGAVTIDKLTQPHEIRLFLRTGGEETLFRTEEENNMRFEIQAFLSAVRGEKSVGQYLDLTEKTLTLTDAACPYGKERREPVGK